MNELRLIIAGVMLWPCAWFCWQGIRYLRGKG